MGCAFAAKVKQKKDEEKKFEKEHKPKKKNQRKKKKSKATPHVRTQALIIESCHLRNVIKWRCES